MAVNSSNAASENAATISAWPAKRRLVVSLALAWHLSALLIGPISLPPSILGNEARTAGGGVGQAYLEATFLDHAYKFFAPDPGPSHLVRYELTLADGTRLDRVFPSLEDQQPRLLYHRFFMLSETLGAFAPPENLDPGTPWESIPLSEPQEKYVQAFAERLKAEHSPQAITLYMVQHRFPSPDEFEAGVKLDDKRLYRERLLYRWRATTPAAASTTTHSSVHFAHKD